jgi:hypothetical protein
MLSGTINVSEILQEEAAFDQANAATEKARKAEEKAKRAKEELNIIQNSVQ